MLSLNVGNWNGSRDLCLLLRINMGRVDIRPCERGPDQLCYLYVSVLEFKRSTCYLLTKMPTLESRLGAHKTSFN